MKISTVSLTFIMGAVSAAALFAVAPSAHAAGLNAQEKALVAAAKKEGEVTLLNPLFSDRTAKR
ncbi:MAG: hypothetical protein OEY85_12435, partial [Rhodospirillales bacterium]|nr:hypothetical protein [Rhodospirillales bacterium]